MNEYGIQDCDLTKDQIYWLERELSMDRVTYMVLCPRTHARIVKRLHELWLLNQGITPETSTVTLPWGWK